VKLAGSLWEKGKCIKVYYVITLTYDVLNRFLTLGEGGISNKEHETEVGFLSCTTTLWTWSLTSSVVFS